jgi:large subunit ribosomal protein L36
MVRPPSRRTDAARERLCFWAAVMKIRHSIRSAKARERNCLVVRRKRRLYVINKKQPRYKTRQG